MSGNIKGIYSTIKLYDYIYSVHVIMPVYTHHYYGSMGKAMISHTT